MFDMNKTRAMTVRTVLGLGGDRTLWEGGRQTKTFRCPRAGN